MAYVNTVRLLPRITFHMSRYQGARAYHWRDGQEKVYFIIIRIGLSGGLTAYVLRGVVRTLKAGA